jgi:sugar lactone lactonase YvrE
VDVPALQSNLGSPEGLRRDNAGRIFFADPWNHVVLRLEVDGTLTRIAGMGNSGFNGDGIPAVQAKLHSPYDVALDSRGNVYIADFGNHRIRKVGKDGLIHTIAGTGVAGYTGDNGPAVQARLRGPYNVAVNAEDHVFISDSFNHVIRRVDHNGIITTIVGAGRRGYAGDGGPATSALLDTPQAVVFDHRGNLIFSDEHNNAIRKISRDGRISTLMGTGTAGYATDGTLAAEAFLHDPEGILVRKNGNLLINDGRNRRILEITKGGKVRNFAGSRH